LAPKTEPIPGTSDIFPEESGEWRILEEAANRIFSRYGYGELRTPVFERTNVFLRSIGTETDIVQKEMYTFEDRGGRSLTLRPEGTAGVLRAVANAGIPQGDERRVYYQGPMFRGERPAAGRKRQFHQIGVECVGKVAPAIDVECIAMLMDYLAEIGLDKIRLLLNTRGVKEDRAVASEALVGYFRDRIEPMCDDCKRRLDTNVWRILDCKVETCREVAEGAPLITDQLSDASRDYFQQVCTGLDALGVEYTQDPRLVRGLDYYEHTVFEVVYEGIGAQNAIAGGGRYKITPPGVTKPVPGVGFAVGVERLLLARQDLGVKGSDETGIDVYLVGLGPEAQAMNLRIAQVLRAQGKTVMMDLEGRGMRGQMRTANKLGARHTYILGEDELARQVIVYKDMQNSEQSEIPLTTLLP
jgi:histidyl-tRNA synthetase